MNAANRGLGGALDRLYRAQDHAPSALDPIHIVRRYEQPADREIAGFCASALAFGRVAGAMRVIERLLEPMGPSPAAYLRRFDPARDGGAVTPIVHRWIRGRDLVALLWVLHKMIESSGTIEGFFADGFDRTAPDVQGGLESFSARALSIEPPARVRPRAAKARGRGFFPRPSAGSACKRLNLFLRWMVRRDGIDLGVWSQVAPAQLVVPLDTHVIRVGRALGLTSRRSAGWTMAAEITASLRTFDPADPVRYDFSLCHVGMRRAAGSTEPARIRPVPLRGFCGRTPTAGARRAGARRRPASRRPSARR